MASKNGFISLPTAVATCPIAMNAAVITVRMMRVPQSSESEERLLTETSFYWLFQHA